jgi:hypothetical protein
MCHTHIFGVSLLVMMRTHSFALKRGFACSNESKTQHQKISDSRKVKRREKKSELQSFRRIAVVKLQGGLEELLIRAWTFLQVPLGLSVKSRTTASNVIDVQTNKIQNLFECLITLQNTTGKSYKFQSITTTLRTTL